MKKQEKPSAAERRDFLVRSAAVASAALLPATGHAQSQNTSATPANESRGPEPGVRELNGQVAMVTGAGRGIGRASAEALARAGAHVVVVDIARNLPSHPVPLASREDLAETVRLVENQGRRAMAVQADVRDGAALRKAAEQALREFGRLDILHANAGIMAQGTIASTSDDQWRLGLDVNVLGVVNALRAVAPGMMERKQGRIIVTASTFGRQGTGDYVPYATAKWALVGLVKSAALDLGRHNITVNAIAPTGVATGFGGTLTAEQRAQADEFFRTSYHALPVGALQPQDIAGSVVFLASPAARFITGAVIDVAAGANARYTA